jgi:plasmid replication initiation protein
MHEIVETEHAVIPETVGLFTGFESMWFSWVSYHDEEAYIYENQMIEVTFNDDILPTMCFITMNRGSWSCQSLKSKNKQQPLRNVIKHLDYCLFKDSKPTLNESPQG